MTVELAQRMTLREAEELLEQVEGYGSVETVRALARLGARVQPPDVIVELGCYKGQGTIALAWQSRAKVIGIDHFRGEKGSPDEGRMRWDHVMGSYYQDCIDNTFDFMDNDSGWRNIQIVMKDSVLAARNFLPIVGLLVVDSSHEWPRPYEEFLAWEPRLTLDATLVFDDSTFPGVQETLKRITVHDWAVTETVDHGRLTVLKRKPDDG